MMAGLTGDEAFNNERRLRDDLRGCNRDDPHNQSRATRGLHDLLRRVEAEYREMPGLSLTVPQAARLWGLDSGTADVILRTLAERQVLRRTTIGTYLRRSRG